MTGRGLRIGIVCPYSFDAPGGVQFHVRDLAEELMTHGHTVSVLAPADDDTPVPDYLVSAGRTVPLRYNGSVARLNFGPLTAARVRRWLGAGHFDVLHLHEPISPSLSMLALWIASGPIVTTFHTAQDRSRALQVAYPLVRPSLEKISARIAVSEDARRRVVEHLGGDAVVVPNGVYVDTFRSAAVDQRWLGTPQQPTIAFLGRLDEPRKGLPVLVQAVPRVLAAYPGARFLIAGRGDDGRDDAIQALGPAADRVEFLGAVSDQDKARLLRSVDLYCAPQTGGESFGIVLVEAMSAGAPVVASDLAAFRRVLGDGRYGAHFATGDGADLATVMIGLLDDPAARATLRERAFEAVRIYDWSVVAGQVLRVYETVLAGFEPGTLVVEDPSSSRTGRRWLR